MTPCAHVKLQAECISIWYLHTYLLLIIIIIIIYISYIGMSVTLYPMPSLISNRWRQLLTVLQWALTAPTYLHCRYHEHEWLTGIEFDKAYIWSRLISIRCVWSMGCYYFSFRCAYLITHLPTYLPTRVWYYIRRLPGMWDFVLRWLARSLALKQVRGKRETSI